MVTGKARKRKKVRLSLYLHNNELSQVDEFCKKHGISKKGVMESSLILLQKVESGEEGFSDLAPVLKKIVEARQKTPVFSSVHRSVFDHLKTFTKQNKVCNGEAGWQAFCLFRAAAQTRKIEELIKQNGGRNA